MPKSVYKTKSSGRIIKSVSLTPEDDALITELNISLSGVLRAKIQEIRENSDKFEKLILERDKKIQELAKKIQEASEKMETAGLSWD